jgi:hypothetical protein
VRLKPLIHLSGGTAQPLEPKHALAPAGSTFGLRLNLPKSAAG